MDKALLRYLPPAAAEAVRKTAALHGDVDEIRMYQGGPIVLVAGGRNISTSIECTEEMLRTTVGELCGHSLYAQEESIRQGYIITSEGIRVGVAGRAICQRDQIERVTDLTSLCIRIPRRFPGAADDLFTYAARDSDPKSLLIFSPPGVGKTTALRELSARLGESHYRVAMIDTRYELSYGLSCECMDVFRGYPRPIGMEMAVRTMNPQFVICDEIFSEADAGAVLRCAASGVAVIASAHGRSPEDLRRLGAVRALLDQGIFPTLVGLFRKDGQLVHTFYSNRGGTITDANDGDDAAVCGVCSDRVPLAKR